MNNRIGVSLILAIGSVTVLIVGIFSFIIIRTHRAALISQVKLYAHQISETIKSSTRNDMLLNRSESLHQIIDTLGRQEGIRKVRLYNKEGKIIYSSEKGEIDTVVDKKAESCFGCHAEDKPLERISMPERSRIFRETSSHNSLGIINPIYNEPSCSEGSCHVHSPSQKVLGVLDVTMPLESVESQITYDRIEMTLLAVIAVTVISILVWFLVFRLVDRPVRKLLRATQRVAAGDLNYKTGVTSQNELGKLAKSFDQMTVQLSEAQKKIYHSQKLASLGRLVAGIAHEINNPLTGVLSYSSVLAKRIKDDEAKKDLEVVIRETKRCREIVKSLLDFARQVPFQKSDLVLNDVIQKALKVIENQLSMSDINVVLELGSPLPILRADPNQLEQVFINLLVNASDAVKPHEGKISIATRLIQQPGGDAIETVVADNGCGIPAESLQHIFEPFYSTKGQKGTGLGLSVVWGIIEEHGGTIRAESETGKGTRMIICLPLAKLDPIRKGANEPGVV